MVLSFELSDIRREAGCDLGTESRLGVLEDDMAEDHRMKMPFRTNITDLFKKEGTVQRVERMGGRAA